MPHAFIARARIMDLTRDDPELRSHFRWESFNAAAYEIGGVLFVLGSVCFFPSLSAWADAGAWIFFAGSVLYLVVTLHDLAEILRRGGGDAAHLRRMELIAAWSYVVGTVMFLVGSVFFLSWMGMERPAAWLFILGSLLFVLGAVINVLQSFLAESPEQLRLMNITGLTFVVGSVLFAVASVPYLWTVRDAADAAELFAFLAWQYLTGSALFLLGGVANHWRTYRLVAAAAAARSG